MVSLDVGLAKCQKSSTDNTDTAAAMATRRLALNREVLFSFETLAQSRQTEESGKKMILEFWYHNERNEDSGDDGNDKEEDLH